MSKRPKKCPKCGSEKVAEILYGMPAFSEELQQEIKNGTIYIGGCILFEDNPKWHCNSCKYEWGIYRH